MRFAIAYEFISRSLSVGNPGPYRHSPMQKTLIYNDDGWSTYMRYPAPMSPEDIIKVTVLPLVNTGVKIFEFGALGSHAVNYRSGFLPLVGDWMEQKSRIDKIHVWRIRATLEHLVRMGTDPLQIVADACHTYGIKCHYTLRMNDGHHTYTQPDGSPAYPELCSDWLEQNSHLRLPIGRLNYAEAAVREYRLSQIDDVLERYPVDGFDLDFTRKRPWFPAGAEEQGRSLMSDLVRRISDRVRRAGRSFSARFEHDYDLMIKSGLDIEGWLRDGLFDHISVGTLGDMWPDPPIGWWVERAHARNCKVFPQIEGQVFVLKTTCGGGTSTRPATDGVHEGYGPPTIEYMRAYASRAYQLGADGICLFNITCADGVTPRSAFTELADPASLKFKPKQYVLAPWYPADEMRIYWSLFLSHVRLDPGQTEVARSFLIADDMEEARRLDLERPSLLTLEMKNLNRASDVDFILNGVKLNWNGFLYNHFDHHCWIDVLQFEIPVGCLRQGENRLVLKRTQENPKFAGPVELRKFILDQNFATSFVPGRLA